MRLAFFGSSRFSCFVLDSLRASSHEIAVVVTQPDQPKGRGMRHAPTELCCAAMSTDYPVLKPESLRGNAAFRRELLAHKPDALLVASYGQIIPSKVLELTPWPLNVHPSLLPALRGATPVRTALLQGLTETGCCIMRMTPRLDDGDVLLREHLLIDQCWNYRELETKLGELGGMMACQTLDAISASPEDVIGTPQDHALATYCHPHSTSDMRIDWQRPARELHDFIRAWDPDVGAWTLLPNGKRLKVWRACLDSPPAQANLGLGVSTPGLVVAVTKKHLWVATGSGSLRIDEVQQENKPRMLTANWLAGARLSVGDRLDGSSELVHT